MVEKTADETSDYHLWELRDHGDRRRVEQAAAWLDSVPHVWLICDRRRVSTFEAAQCLSRLSGLDAPPDAELFTGSTTVALAGNFSIDLQSEVFGKRIQDLVADVHGYQTVAMNQLKAAMLDGLGRLRDDETTRKAALGKGAEREHCCDGRFLDQMVAPQAVAHTTDGQYMGWLSRRTRGATRALPLACA